MIDRTQSRDHDTHSVRSAHSRRSAHSTRPPSTTPSVVEIAHAIEDATTLPPSEGGTKVDVDVEEKEGEGEHDELPNGGYGWVIMVCLLGLNACTWGEWAG